MTDDPAEAVDEPLGVAQRPDAAAADSAAGAERLADKAVGVRPLADEAVGDVGELPAAASSPAGSFEPAQLSGPPEDPSLGNARRDVGVGPYPRPWPDDPRLDPALLESGDRRNVIDKYRYWSVEAIRADLAPSRAALQIAIENLAHDLNIGSIVRTGNAFNVSGVHIVGRKRWNRKGALVTDRYVDVFHRPEARDVVEWARANDYAMVAVDNPPGSAALEETRLPERCLLVFGQESSGISPELLAACDFAVRIEQYGSTRSMNVAAAAAIAMHWWSVQHR